MNTFYKFALIFAALTLTVQSAPSFMCNKFCTRIYDPVCAFNGQCYQTFASDCFLHSRNCENRLRNEIEFLSSFKGECDSSRHNTCSDVKFANDIPEVVQEEECNEMCTRKYEPVCGFNGQCYQSFPNNCILNSSNCKNRQSKGAPEFVFTSEGECKTDNVCPEFKIQNDVVPEVVPEDECSEICTREYEPVCGFNGQCYQFFSNNCIMESKNCKIRQQKNISEFKLVSTEKCVLEVRNICDF